jgi:hypothetical protein
MFIGAKHTHTAYIICGYVCMIMVLLPHKIFFLDNIEDMYA